MISSDSYNTSLLNFTLLARCPKSRGKVSTYLNGVNGHGRTALILAALHGHTEIVKVLLAAEGIEVNARGEKQGTALHFAAQQGHLAIVKALIGHKDIDLEVCDGDEDTSLHLAIKEGHTAIVQALIEAGAEINGDKHKNYSSLTRAVDQGHIAIVRILINAGADVNVGNYTPTPLMFAVKEGHTEIVEALLATKNINLNAVNGYNQTALNLAFQNGHTKIIQALIATFEVVSAARNGNTEEVIALIDKAPYLLNREIEGGLTLLSLAAKWGHTDTVQALIRAGADVNAGPRTALMYAAKKGYTEIVKALLAVNARDHDGWTEPMLAAQHSGYIEIVQAFILASANVNSVISLDKNMLLKNAYCCCQTKMVESLILAGATVDSVNNNYENTTYHFGQDLSGQSLHLHDAKFDTRKEVFQGGRERLQRINTEGLAEILKILRSLPWIQDAVKVQSPKALGTDADIGLVLEEAPQAYSPYGLNQTIAEIIQGYCCPPELEHLSPMLYKFSLSPPSKKRLLDNPQNSLDEQESFSNKKSRP